MKRTTRKHIRLASLLMAVAVVGMLAALVALSGGFARPGATQAQTFPFPGGATPTMAAPATAMPTSTSTFPFPGGTTPTMAVPTTAPSTPNVDDSIESSSTSASATVKLELTIGNLAEDVRGGSSVELYLEDDFVVPDSIARDTVYFTVDNPPTDATSNGGRVYATDPIEVDTDGHFTADKDDYAIQVVLPDFNTADRPEFDGFNGPTRGQTLKLVFTKGAGIKNPSEQGTHSVGYAVLGPNDDANDGPTHSTLGMGAEQVSNLVVKPAAEKNAAGADTLAQEPAKVGLKTLAKISLSDVDNSRGYNLVVTGSGFTNGVRYRGVPLYHSAASTQVSCRLTYCFPIQ